ncbi:hypothetical protein EVAR_38098_1 [Eumeta japonica]|uniref:Uncharacterized protein n=1 Tax=Eumeta variegata TaxID=151549 RepID=A0A4C1W9Z3_EUMVA|nr:hypothetical protein EVAR_38098_1 [Eumeta japonica]
MLARRVAGAGELLKRYLGGEQGLPRAERPPAPLAPCGSFITVLLQACCARGRPIIVEWERDARHSAGLSLVRAPSYMAPGATAPRCAPRPALIDTWPTFPSAQNKFN